MIVNLAHERKKKELYASDWFKCRPHHIQELIRLRSPFYQYHLTTDKQPYESYYIIRSYWDDGTITAVRYYKRDDSAVWSVFGLDPQHLEPWRLIPGVESTQQAAV